MLRINHGQTRPFCDGVSRRRFLEIGSLGAFGLSLSSLLRSETVAADASGRGIQHASKRSVILIWQHGGPSQLDTFDMKPLAPSEIRGPYRSIASSLPFPKKIFSMGKPFILLSFSLTDNCKGSG